MTIDVEHADTPHGYQGLPGLSPDAAHETDAASAGAAAPAEAEPADGGSATSEPLHDRDGAPGRQGGVSVSAPQAQPEEEPGLVPEPTEGILAAAEASPNSWCPMTDPSWDERRGPAPDWAVIGWWWSGETGELESWKTNPAYRPSPRALGWPAPTDPVDDVLQLAGTGYLPPGEVTLALAGHQVAVFVHAGGEPLTGAAPDRTPVIPVYTSPQYIQMAGRMLYEVRPVSAVVASLPDGHQLYLNPTGPVSMLVETEELIEAEAALAEMLDEPVEPGATLSVNLG
ncbi:type VII secretion system-associated protein [Streptomyces sp. NBC_00151]|uniref:type VII secretion system-associated protein n=1 Tax=Streptomyces sp. NBC_00151 TaxID=2975669 RepID=UPI002DD9F8FB|nr:type VII secretion system-associated protein [Streptomyces sp. NBC_00151]WRZ36774.1 type VII secretion system-associated protein [Streptomyces sp. NBC_00151]WRZ44803.1 type VII secretion system-associated protein [Streptomyces sp. NBC_00151]